MHIEIKQATKNGTIKCKIGGLADLSYPKSKTRRGRVQEMGNICPTLTTGEGGIYRIEEGKGDMKNKGIRLRNLTNRERGRFMGVEENDITKMMKVNKDSQLCKQFGNSIVVDCMVAMFSQLNIKDVEPWNEKNVG